MSVPFNSQHGLIIVRSRLWGPTGQTDVRLALDTGATSTVLRPSILVSIGYDPAAAPARLQMTTGSGVEFVARLPLDRREALGQQRSQFPVVAHTLPPTATIDGLLGLDFLRGRRLTIDFRRARITLR
jgi:predicted aspartyl protease